MHSYRGSGQFWKTNIVKTNPSKLPNLNSLTCFNDIPILHCDTASVNSSNQETIFSPNNLTLLDTKKDADDLEEVIG